MRHIGVMAGTGAIGLIAIFAVDLVNLLYVSMLGEQAIAAFNNLGHPLWSTGFNWGRATLGTIPFAWWGSHYGPVEVLAGQAAGAALFGSLAMYVAFQPTRRLGQQPFTNRKP
jgi:hypothetical protein